MKAFIVFAGSTYYPSGGWSDFSGTFDTRDEGLVHVAITRLDWWQIVETSTMQVVSEGERQ